MRIILIGNYSKDKQESMNRFAFALYQGYKAAGVSAEVWLPDVVFAKWAKSSNVGLGKWLGYIDKFLIFSIKIIIKGLKKTSRSHDTKFHICDHSNSIYLKFLPVNRTVITCHDVLAIRGAFGYADAYCPATKTGIILQRIILKRLGSAKKLVAVSQFTLNQLKELLSLQLVAGKFWNVIHNGFNENFWRMEDAQAFPLLQKINISTKEKYILHVGSNLLRKNRKMLLDMVYNSGDQYQGKICFAGHEIDEELMAHAVSLNLESRLISVDNPDHITLVALYSKCHAFIFPSFSEGFGWPLIEAQACGAPVITSQLQPFQEVAGNGALYANPYKPKDFSTALIKLNDNNVKFELIQFGFDNCARFDQKNMIEAYLKVHTI